MTYLILILILSPAFAQKNELEEALMPTYLGTCTINKTSPFDAMKNTESRCYFKAELVKPYVHLKILLFDGLWESEPVYAITSYHSFYDKSTIGVNSTASFLSHSKNTTCEVIGCFFFYNDEAPYYVLGGIEAGGSDDCNFIMDLKLDEFPEIQIREQVITYSFIFSCLSLMVLYAYIKQINLCVISEALSKKNSLIMWIMHASNDLVLCIFHLAQAQKSISQFDYYLLAACWGFCCMVIVKSRLIPIVWRAGRSDIGTPEFRQAMNSFNGKIVFVLFIIIAFVVIFDSFYLFFIVLLYSFFVPQIVKTAIDGVRNPLSNNVIHCLALPRVIFVLYMLGCPANILIWKPQPVYAIFIALYVYLQVLVIYLQRRFGTRFFIPKQFRPTVYSYYRSLEEEQCRDEKDCTICMNQIEYGGTSRIMHTPCNHLFHEECLNNWMAIKAECPTCRSSLPVVEEE